MPTRSQNEPVLDNRSLNRALLARQLLLRREKHPAEETITRLVGMQAQLPNNPYVALWSRLRGFDPLELSQAIEQRRAVRIALMRSTIHLVTAADCLLLRPIVQPVLDRMFGPDSTWTRAMDGVDISKLIVAGRELVEEEPRGHKQLGDLLAQRWPKHDPHALAMAIRNKVPLVQVPPRGLWGKAGRPLVTSAESWLGRPLVADPSIDQVVLRYLRAFGPASAADFRRWSGLTGHRDAFERLRPQLLTFRDERDKELFDVPDAPRPGPDVEAPVRFLPEYDNVSLSHADRSRIISREAIELGTIGKPFLLLDGYVAGAWTLDRKKAATTLVVTSFAKLSARDRSDVHDEGGALLELLAAGTSHDIRIAEGKG